MDGELGTHLTQCRLGRGLYLCTKWYPEPLSRFTWAEKWAVIFSIAKNFREATAPNDMCYRTEGGREERRKEGRKVPGLISRDAIFGEISLFNHGPVDHECYIQTDMITIIYIQQYRALH